MTMTGSRPETTFAVKDVPSALVTQTLLDRELVRPIDRPVRRLLPWLKVVALGGHSIVDPGLETLGPIIDELREGMAEHRMLVLTGSGIRARHVMGVGLDLGLPTGVLAGMAAVEAEQNGHLVAALLASEGVSYLPHTAVAHQLAVHLAASRAVVSNGYPPYGLYEFPPQVGKIPPHRSDAGAFLLADAYGASSTIFVKNVDGVFTSDPAADENAELIPRISAAELRQRNLGSLPVDAVLLDLMPNAKNLKEIQIINGRTPGNLTKALAGEHVGTIIHTD